MQVILFTLVNTIQEIEGILLLHLNLMDDLSFLDREIIHYLLMFIAERSRKEIKVKFLYFIIYISKVNLIEYLISWQLSILILQEF